ncbi:MAG TPA: enoyl-CoA hydratase/isomerase family protein, partial [Tepidiformaceae bacterium]|nr:enoyl-CoA hydratase/isomerase family protein [Tepidiformaceae bacterium]
MTDAESLVRVEVADGIATVTMHRPEKLNAINDDLAGALVAAFRSLEHRDDARVVVLTGAGRGFCAGADLSAPASPAGHGTTAFGGRS